MGATGALLVAQYLEQHRSHVAEHVDSLISRARQRLVQRENSQVSVSLRNKLNAVSDLTGRFVHSTDSSCPACESTGSLEGDDGELEVDWDYEEPWARPVATLRVYSLYFSCPNCALVLNRSELIEQAGLETSFDVEVLDYEPDYEPDYGND